MNKKQDKFVLLMKSLLPVLVAIILQLGLTFIADMVVTIKVSIDFAKVANAPDQNPELVSGPAFEDAITRKVTEIVTTEPFYSTSTLIMFLVMAAFFTLWFFAGKFHRGQTSVKEALPLRNIGIILISGVLLQLGVSMLLNVVLPLFPKIESQYAQLLEALVPESDMLSVRIMSAVSLAILAPITEELIFRGISLGNLRKFWSLVPAVIFQAFLFGLYHMNIVQGVYAFIIGMLLGYLAYKLNNLLASILLHAAINGSSLILEYIVPEAAIQTNTMALFIGIVCLIAVVALFVLLKLPEPVVYADNAAQVIAESINASYPSDNPLSRVDFSAPVRTPDILGEIQPDADLSQEQAAPSQGPEIPSQEAPKQTFVEIKNSLNESIDNSSKEEDNR